MAAINGKYIIIIKQLSVCLCRSVIFIFVVNIFCGRNIELSIFNTLFPPPRTCEDEEVIELIPVHSNYDMVCGTKLEIKLLPKSANSKGPHRTGPNILQGNGIIFDRKRDKG